MIPYPPATVEASRERLFAARSSSCRTWRYADDHADVVDAVVHGIGHDVTQELPADTVVVVSYHQPNVELADHLTEPLTAGCRLHLVGDVTGTSSILRRHPPAAAIARAL